jgi:DNA-binding NtrC family response regulator
LLCEQFTARIHLLLTDLVMPRMSGRQLAVRLAKIRPDMKVLYMSGYADDTTLPNGVLAGGIDLLQKPVMPAALSRKVRQVLDAPARATLHPATLAPG